MRERERGEGGRQMMKMMLSQSAGHSGRQAGSPSLNSLALAEEEELSHPENAGPRGRGKRNLKFNS